jgi:hypothetical protein
MSSSLSFRRRNISNQSARLLQPFPWSSSLGAKFLNYNNTGSSMTASATPNTPGSWIQYIANNVISATDIIQSLHIQAIGNNQTASTDNSMLLDIAKGASGSEVIIAQNIAVGGAWNTSGAGPFFHLPIRIEGATRVAMRVRAAVGSRVLTLQQLVASGAPDKSPFADRLPTSVDTLGTSTATSTGTAMTGASGTWTEITASTTKDYQSLIVIPSGPANITGASSTQFRLDLGLGAAGSESVVAFYSGSYASNGFVFPLYLSATSAIYSRFVPAGTRIAVRHNLSANPERICACVIGVPYV